MSNRTYEEVREIYLNSPEQQADLQRYADTEGDPIRELELRTQIDNEQAEYLRPFQIEDLGYKTQGDLVTFTVKPSTGPQYSIAGREQFVVDQIVNRQNAQQAASSTGEAPDTSSASAPESPPAPEDPETEEEVKVAKAMNSSDFIIPYEYEGVKRTFPIRLPIKPESSGIEVQIIKYFLGMGGILEVDDFYDIKTQMMVTKFQDENRDRIYEIGSFPVTQFGDIPIVGSIAEFLPGDTRAQIDLPSGFLSERGQVGKPTYLTMVEQGLLTAARQVLEDPNSQNLISLLKSGESDPTAYLPQSQAQQPPVRRRVGDEQFVFYTLVTKYRAQEEQQFEQQKKILFRQAVRNVFNYYGKSTTWEIDGTPRTGILDPLYNLIGDDNDLPRRKYEQVVLKTRGMNFSQNQKFLFTIRKPNSLTDQIRAGQDRSPLATPSPVPKEMDVLFMQPLAEGADPIFASISRIFDPRETGRPSAKWQIEIKIKADLFDLISGSSPAGGTVDLFDPDVYNNIVGGFDKVSDFVQNDLGRPFTEDFWNDRKDNLKKWADSKKRKFEKDAKKAASNYWQKAKTGQGGGLTDAERSANFAQNDANETVNRIKNNAAETMVKEYRINQIIERIDFILKEIKDYPKQIQEFIEKNRIKGTQFRRAHKPLSPSVDFPEIIREFGLLKNAIGTFLSINGYDIRVGPTSKDAIKFHFRAVRRPIPITPPEDDSLAPRLDRRQDRDTELETYQALAGYQIHKAEYAVGGFETGKPEFLVAGTQNFAAEEPFNSPTTVAYLMQMDKIFEELNKASKDCDDLKSYEALEFLSKFHFPLIQINVKPKSSRALVNIRANIDVRSILNAAQELEEAQLLASQSIENLRQSTFLEQKGKTISTKDVLPRFGEISCDIKAMFEQFLNKWDVNYLLCEYTKCVPGLPPWNLNFNFAVPAFPKLRPFDPLNFVIPQIKVSIENIIMTFLCNFIKRLLETIRYPDCVELLSFGAVALSEIQKLLKDDPILVPFENAEERLSLLEKTVLAIEEMNIPRSALSGETEDTISALMDQISAVITPFELCAILEGEADTEVYVIVQNVILSSQSILRKYLSSIKEIRTFFKILGTVVDPYFCEKIKELTDSGALRSTIGCEDQEETIESRIRRELSDVNAPEETIKKALKDAEKRKQIFDKLAQTGDFSELMPELSNAGLQGAGMPSPENNPDISDGMRTVVSTVVESVKEYYNTEINVLAERYINSETIDLIQPGEPEFNSYDYVLYRFYLHQLENIEIHYGRIREIKSIIEVSIAGTFSELQEQALIRIGIPIEEHMFITHAIDLYPMTGDDGWTNEDGIILRLGIEDTRQNGDGSRREDGDSQLKIQQTIAEITDTYLTEYLRRYSKSNKSVFPELKVALGDYATTCKKTGPGPEIEIGGRRLSNGDREQSIFMFKEIPYDNDIAFRGLFTTRYSEMPFVGLPQQDDGGVKDCYRVQYRDDHFLSGARTLDLSTVYNETLPPPWIQKRKQSPDVSNRDHGYKLLRPGGFAELMIDSYKKLVEDVDADTFMLDQTYRSSHLQYLIQGEKLSVSSPIGETTQPSLYSSYVNSFVSHMAELTTNSNLFEIENLQQLEEDIGKPFTVNREAIPRCFIKNPKALDFQKFIQSFAENYSKSIAVDNEPLGEKDLTVRGNIQNNIIANLFKMYIGFFVLEKFFKAVFMFSNFGPRSVTKEQIFLDYIYESVSRELLDSIRSTSTSSAIMQLVKDITLETDSKEAIRKLAILSLDIGIIEDYAMRLFGLQYKSYKDLVYKQLIENIKSVPSITNYPKVIARPGGRFDPSNRSPLNAFGYETVPLSYRLPNLYEQFNFKGYTEDMVNLKLNSGHFWIEKYYKIDNFEEFFTKYKSIENTLDYQNIRYPLLNIGDDPSSSLFSEHISPEDLDQLLFGSTSEEEQTNFGMGGMSAVFDPTFAARNAYAKMIMVKSLNHYFSRRWPLNNREGLRETSFDDNLIYRLMTYLGMSEPDLGYRQSRFDLGQAPEKYIIRAGDHGESSGRSTMPQDRIDSMGGITEEQLLLPGVGGEMSTLERMSYVGNFVTELDLAVRNGSVSRTEIAERLFRLIAVLEQVDNSRDGEVPLFELLRGTRPPQFVEPEFAPYANDPEFGSTAENLWWVYDQFFKPGTFTFENESPDIFDWDASDVDLSRLDKCKIFVDFLVEFVEMTMNWPVNGTAQFRNNDESQGLRAPVVRDVRRANLFFEVNSTVAYRIASTRLSEEYNEGLGAGQFADWYEGDPPPIEYTWYDTLPYKPSGNGISERDSMGFDATRRNDEIDANGTSKWVFSPYYRPGDGSQEMVLKYYQSLIVQDIRDDISIDTVTSGLFNLVDAASSNIALVRAQGLDNFLAQNLKVGFRLMTGHKLKRNDNVKGNLGYIGPSESYIGPNDIFTSMTPSMSTAALNTEVGTFPINNNIGVLEDVNLFSKKKCFIGYAERDNVVDENGAVNDSSVFATNAREAFEKINSNSVFTSVPNQNGGMVDVIDLDPFVPRLQDALVYSIPVQEAEYDLDCLQNIFKEQGPTLSQLNYPFVFDQVQDLVAFDDYNSLRVARRRSILRTVHENYQEKAMSDLLSVRRGEVKPYDVNDDPENEKTHRYLFDFLFPIHRYECMHAIQNNMIFDKYVPEDQNKIFESTRLFILNVIERVGGDPVDNSVSNSESSQIVMNSLGELDEVNSLTKMLKQALKKLGALGASSALRNAATYTDPAYADMRRQYKKDPCSMDQGLTGNLTFRGSLRGRGYDVEDGFVKLSDQCKSYVPVNNMPGDLVNAVVSNPIQTFRNIRNVVSLFTGLVTNNKKRYGYFLGPVGFAALRTIELPGEAHSKLRKDNDCSEDCFEQDYTNLKPRGLCTDDE